MTGLDDVTRRCRVADRHRLKGYPLSHALDRLTSWPRGWPKDAWLHGLPSDQAAHTPEQAKRRWPAAITSTLKECNHCKVRPGGRAASETVDPGRRKPYHVLLCHHLNHLNIRTPTKGGEGFSPCSLSTAGHVVRHANHKRCPVMSLSRPAERDRTSAEQAARWSSLCIVFSSPSCRDNLT